MNDAKVFFQVWSLTFTVLWVIYANLGGTRHVYYLSNPTIESALKINWISQTFCVLGLIFGKLSVGFLIMRIGIPKKNDTIFALFSFGQPLPHIVLGYCLRVAQCILVTKLWHVNTPGKCWNPQLLTVLTLISGSKS